MTVKLEPVKFSPYEGREKKQYKAQQHLEMKTVKKDMCVISRH